MSPEIAAQRHLTCATWSQLRRCKRGRGPSPRATRLSCGDDSIEAQPFHSGITYTELLEMLMLNDLFYMKKWTM